MLSSRRQGITTWCLLWILALLTACGGGGGGAEPEPPPSASAVIRATALAVNAGSTAVVQAPVGSTITLDGGASTAQGGINSWAWSVVSRPTGSTASIASATTAVASFVPDAVGTYEFRLQVTGTSGASASAALTVNVVAATPVVNVVTSVNFIGPVTTLPAQSVALGSIVALDAAGSTDGAGQPVALSWQLVSAPSGSASALSVLGATARFTPDLAGAYQVRARGTSSTGLYADTVHSFNVSASAPTVVVASSITAVATASTVTAGVGNLVTLDGGASQTSGAGSGSWALQSKPSGSSLGQLNAVGAMGASFVPDLPGTYVLQFTLLDRNTGQSSFHRVRVDVVASPVPLVAADVAPVAAVSGPTYLASAGGPVTLRGGGSHDPNGSALTYAWTLQSRPAASNAALSGASTVNAGFTPDVNGTYVIRLAVTNAAGVSASQTISLYVGNLPPVAVVDRSQAMVLTGRPLSVSASGSYSQGGGSLSYSWALDARPAGSTAALASTSTATLNFTPDVAGTYLATVTVTEGSVSSIASVSITALSATAGTVPLTYRPLITRYSKALGKAVIVSSTPDVLHLVDPSAATDVEVPLPAGLKAMSLSPDGLLAAVLHEGAVSLIDLASARLLATSATNGSQTEVFVTDSGLIALTGQTGGQWVSPPFSVINGRTGAVLQTGGGFASIYGTAQGVLSGVRGKLYTLSNGLSPADITATVFDVNTGAFGASADSPYHGDYAMGNPLWLSGDESLIFTQAGTYFRTSDLVYVGNLGISLTSMSHSSAAAELVALQYQQNTSSWPYTASYPSVYKRFTGSLLFPAADVTLPMVGGSQSYGLAIFHAADDRKVIVAQTGGNTVGATGLQYFLLLR